MEPPATQQRGNRPGQFRLSLSVTPGNAREFELWRWGYAPLYTADALQVRARASFSAEMTGYVFGNVSVACGQSSAAVFERTAHTIARSGIDAVALLVYTEGGCALDIEGRAAEVNTGDVSIFDTTRRSVVRAPDYRNLSIVMPRALLAPHVADLDSLHGLILRTSTPLNALLVSHLRTLYAEAPALSLPEVHAATRATAALIAAFAGPSADGRDAIAQTAAAASLQVLRQAIEANLHDPDLGPELICRTLGMSRAKLYRLFEPLGGVSHYIQQRRVARAYQVLTDPAYARACRCDRGPMWLQQCFGVQPRLSSDLWHLAKRIAQRCRMRR